MLRAVVLRDLAHRNADRIAVMWTRNTLQRLPDGCRAADMRPPATRRPGDPLYVPARHLPPDRHRRQTSNDPELSREAIRAEMRALDPAVPPYGILPVEPRVGRTVALRTLQTLLLALAGVALIRSVIGVYGVMHRSVAARTREIGVRMALGASASAVRRMVLTGGLAPARLGLVLGLLGSLALSRTMAAFLHETAAIDPIIYALVTALLLAATIAACLVPAARAARSDPMAAPKARVRTARERAGQRDRTSLR